MTGPDHGTPLPRVRITAPSARPAPEKPTTTTGGIEAVYVRSLIRSQRRLAIVCAAVFALVVASYAVVFVLFPELDRVHLGELPLSWIVVGAGVYPVALLIALIFVRAAGRNEDRYRALADKP